MPAARPDKILIRFARLGLALVLAFAGIGGAVSCGGKGSPAAVAGRPSRPAVSTAPAVAIELRRWTAPREVVRVGLQGVVIGPETGPLEWKLFVEPRRADEVWYFLGTYAPFTEKAGPEEISFHGRGRIKAGAAEQRMIREWTRQVATEAVGGLGDAAYGLALAWHQGGTSGICFDLTLSLPGEAVASACGWPGEIRGRLDPAALARVYAWFDRLKPFQSGAEEPESPGGTRNGSLDTRVIFAAKGSHSASAAEEAEIRSFAASLFAELAARRPNPAPVPAGAPPAEPPARFLLPANAAPPKAEEVPLRFPEKPPAPPVSAPRPAGNAGHAGNAGSSSPAALPTSPPPPGNPGR